MLSTRGEVSSDKLWMEMSQNGIHLTEWIAAAMMMPESLSPTALSMEYMPGMAAMVAVIRWCDERLFPNQHLT
jgi:hypothetical protein